MCVFFIRCTSPRRLRIAESNFASMPYCFIFVSRAKLSAGREEKECVFSLYDAPSPQRWRLAESNFASMPYCFIFASRARLSAGPNFVCFLNCKKYRNCKKRKLQRLYGYFFLRCTLRQRLANRCQFQKIASVKTARFFKNAAFFKNATLVRFFQKYRVFQKRKYAILFYIC